MNKIIGYGASLLVLAAAGSVFFGASPAQAGDSHWTEPGPSGGDECKDKLSGLCECVKMVLKDIKYAEKNGSGKIKHPEDVLDDAKDDLRQCVKMFCKDDESSCDW
ncbi:hypothetical protein [Sorangium sp. So ce693]|uniref:hypothetical protein n=1 Tax=Sorangium sp. So ce693 TaxID=3133318 RepID=UPI003F5F4CE6